MNTMSFYEYLDLNKQAHSLQVTFSGKTKSYHSQTCLKYLLGLVNISLGQLGSVNISLNRFIGLDWLISVWIG